VIESLPNKCKALIQTPVLPKQENRKSVSDFEDKD
jgi:hypothetical protein